MSTQQPERHVARYVFPAELNAATYSFSKRDDIEQAPIYVLLPSGSPVNRICLFGTLTETTDKGSDSPYWQGRFVDFAGNTAFAYAGQYQPGPANFLRAVETPVHAALVGKPRVYETDENSLNVTVEPEHIAEISQPLRQRWTAMAAERTISRLDAFQAGEAPFADAARDTYGDQSEAIRSTVIKNLKQLSDTISNRD